MAFIIKRLNHYKLLAPIIEESLRRGYHVLCLHNYGVPSTGMKGYNFPLIESAPSFKNGSPEFLSYDVTKALIELIPSRKIQIIVSLEAPSRVFSSSFKPENVLWALVQYGADVFDIHDPMQLLEADLFFCLSDKWVRLGEEFYKIMYPDQIKRGLYEKVKAKIRIIGFPELDSTSMISPDSVKDKLGLKRERPVILYLPLPSYASYRNYWETDIFPRRSVKQLLGAVKIGRMEFLKHWWKKWNDFELVRSLKEFADRNDAYFIAKSRKKNPIQHYLSDIADLAMYDESDYPATILKLLMISDLVISFYNTTTALEAAWCNVPFLSFYPIDRNLHDVSDETKKLIDGKAHEAKISVFFNNIPSSIHNYQKVNQKMEIPYAIENLGSMNLSDFTLNEQARSSYVKMYLGFDDGKSSVRLLNFLEEYKLAIKMKVQVNSW
tara:strand:+ start:3319 stop:4632 length:1314 start_codon:yes stop_codon:yes gene_type:complete